MPLLDPDRRKSIDERLALYQTIKEQFKDRQYFSVYCYLCGWASNGLTLEEAGQVNCEHVATHPEDATIKATQIDIADLRDSFHDHDCTEISCSCKCGCRSGPFCGLVLGNLCSYCLVREGRGDSGHGVKSDAQ